MITDASQDEGKVNQVYKSFIIVANATRNEALVKPLALDVNNILYLQMNEGEKHQSAMGPENPNFAPLFDPLFDRWHFRCEHGLYYKREMPRHAKTPHVYSYA